MAQAMTQPGLPETQPGLRPKASRAPFFGIAALALVVLAIGAIVHARGPAMPAPVVGSALASRDLFFEDRDDGAIVVRDAAGPVIAVLPSGTNGFVRAAMRGLARDRRRDSMGPEAPFRLTQWSVGRLTLTDTATGRMVDLVAFGPSQVEAFQAFLKAGGS